MPPSGIGDINNGPNGYRPIHHGYPPTYIHDRKGEGPEEPGWFLALALETATTVPTGTCPSIIAGARQHTSTTGKTQTWRNLAVVSFQHGIK